MNQLEQARERVCKSLMTRVEHYDKLLEESDLITEKEKVARLYTYQTTLLNRLEKVIGS